MLAQVRGLLVVRVAPRIRDASQPEVLQSVAEEPNTKGQTLSFCDDDICVLGLPTHRQRIPPIRLALLSSVDLFHNLDNSGTGTLLDTV